MCAFNNRILLRPGPQHAVIFGDPNFLFAWSKHIYGGDISLDHKAFTNVNVRDEPEVDPTKWRELLLLFRYVKTLNVHDHLVKEVSRCLELDD